MKTGDTLYMVRNRVKPERGRPFVDWLDRKHNPEVVALAGVEWGHRIALDQQDERGREVHLLIYKFESRGALDAYLESDARKGFWDELKAFDAIHEGERSYGEIAFSAPA